MLLSLTVKDFIIVDHLTLHFSDGFNVLTGETGAGKSILIDAVSLLLGDRADSKQVRSGAPQAEISATFNIAGLSKLQDWLKDQQLLADETTLLLKRHIDRTARSRNFVNHQGVTLTQLKTIGEYLVDIHGQQTHQSLGRADTQRLLLDAYAKASSLALDVAIAWRAWSDAMQAKQSAEQSAHLIQQEREVLIANIEEVVDLALQPNEWETLNARHRQLAHVKELIEATQQALLALSEDDNNCLALLSQSQHCLNRAAHIDQGLLEMQAILESAVVGVKETAHYLRQYLNRLDEDPDQLVGIENRISGILGVARKHHVQPEALLETLATWQMRLTQLDATIDLMVLVQEEEQAKNHYYKLARQLTQQRTQAIGALEKKVVSQMRFLAMPDAHFEIRLTPLAIPASYGLEAIDYQVAINKGTTLRPLAKVASGGELSRMSLAMQVAISEVSSIPTLIFDEVDSGVGGGVAETIGQLLKNLGIKHQVFVITHLPQVAVYGKTHWQVSKDQQRHTVEVKVKSLIDADRVQEVARMLGGLQITDATYRHAEEMLSMGSKAPSNYLDPLVLTP